MKNIIYRPTWAEIDLSAIRHNFLQFRKLTDSSVRILVAVKANAYGHGLIEISKTLQGCGADYLGTGTIDEAIQLKNAKIKVPILNLTAIGKDEIEPALNYKIIQTVPDLYLAKLIDRIAAKKSTKAKVHLKIDTGMGRLGVWHNEAINFVKEVFRLKNLSIEGIFTHFSSADEDALFTGRQINNFLLLLNKLKDMGMDIKYKHAANSAAAISYYSAHLNIIRPGIMIYGLYPSPAFKSIIKLKPALSLKSKISYIKETPKGRRISYSGTYITKKFTKIATIPIGYGDGYNRLLSNKGTVLIHGKKAPVLGRVCMDQTMIDVGNIKNTSVGDEVVLIGRQVKNIITAEEIAALCQTIPYEVTCWISARVPRVYRSEYCSRD